MKPAGKYWIMRITEYYAIVIDTDTMISTDTVTDYDNTEHLAKIPMFRTADDFNANFYVEAAQDLFPRLRTI